MPLFQQKPQTSRTILDVLIEQGLVSKESAQEIGLKAHDNLAIERLLKEENLLDEATLSKAYAVYFNLPFVVLQGRTIAREILEIIPFQTAQKYQIIAYELNPGLLKIAIANPARLPVDAREVLLKIGQEKNIKLELTITTPQDIAWAIKSYPQAQPMAPLPSAKPQPPLPPAPPTRPPAPVPEPPSPAPPPPPPPKPASSDVVGKVTLTGKKIPLEVLEKFPHEVAQKYKMVVFEAPSPTKIKVAVSEPANPRVKEILKFIKEKNEIEIEEYLTSENDINFALRFYPRVAEVAPKPAPGAPQKAPFGEIPEVKSAEVAEETEEKEKADFMGLAQEAKEAAKQPKIPEEMEEKDLDKFLKEKVDNLEDLKALVRTGFVPKIVAAMLILATKKGASDIHLEPLVGFLRLRFRLDGILEDVLKIPIEMHPAIISRIKILAKLKLDEQRVPQDGRFNIIVGGHEIDLRTSTLPTVHGEKVVLRILDKSVGILTLEQLGMTDRNFKVLVEAIQKPYGVVLSTGPTGSGKSTTLYAILNRLSTPGVNIITLEDPVEYEIPGINQCQVKPQIGFSFADGLRSVLRQDPNIIMVGEIRDSETAGMATHAALTGHLVLSTLHTNDAAGALPRLINMGVEPFLITSSVNAIIGQRLVRKICQKCKTEQSLPGKVIQDLKNTFDGAKAPEGPWQFWHGKGCGQCHQGYKGRIGIFEVLIMSDKIEELAISRAPSSEIQKQTVLEGMTAMKQDGILKAIKGITTIDEVLRATSMD